MHCLIKKKKLKIVFYSLFFVFKTKIYASGRVENNCNKSERNGIEKMIIYIYIYIMHDLVCTSMWSPTLTTNAFGMELTLTHLPWCCTWSPEIPFCMRRVNRPWSECGGIPIASSGSGQGGYKFAARSCKPNSKFKAFCMWVSPNPKLIDIPFSNSMAKSLLLLLYSSKISLL